MLTYTYRVIIAKHIQQILKFDQTVVWLWHTSQLIFKTITLAQNNDKPFPSKLIYVYFMRLAHTLANPDSRIATLKQETSFN